MVLRLGLEACLLACADVEIQLSSAGPELGNREYLECRENRRKEKLKMMKEIEEIRNTGRAGTIRII